MHSFSGSPLSLGLVYDGRVFFSEPGRFHLIGTFDRRDSSWQRLAPLALLRRTEEAPPELTGRRNFQRFRLACSIVGAAANDNVASRRSAPLLLPDTVTSREIQLLEKTVGTGDDFFVLDVLTGQRSRLLAPECASYPGSCRGIGFAVEATQFLEIPFVASGGAGFEVALNRFPNLNQPRLARIERQSFFNAREGSGGSAAVCSLRAWETHSST